jgi:hypothetical protein
MLPPRQLARLRSQRPETTIIFHEFSRAKTDAVLNIIREFGTPSNKEKKIKTSIKRLALKSAMQARKQAASQL